MTKAFERASRVSFFNKRRSRVSKGKSGQKYKITINPEEETKSNSTTFDEALMTQQELFLLYLLSGFLTIDYYEMCCLHQCETHGVIYEEASPLFTGNLLRLQALATLKILKATKQADCPPI